MKKLLYILLLLISGSAYGQIQDLVRTRQVAASGANQNNQAVHDASLRVDASFGLPRHPANGLYGAKDSSSYVFYNTSINKIEVYKGSGQYDTLVTHVTAPDLSSYKLKADSVSNSGYVTHGYATQNLVPYNNAAFNIDLNGKNLTNVSTFSATHGSIASAPTNPTDIVRLTDLNSFGALFWPLGGAANFNSDVDIEGIGHNFQLITDDATEQSGLIILPNFGELFSQADDGSGGSAFVANFDGSISMTGGFGGSTNKGLSLSRDLNLFTDNIHGRSITLDSTFFSIANLHQYDLIPKKYADSLMAAAANYISTNSTQTGLTGNKSTSGIWNTSGQWRANGGVTPDGMGPINVTMPTTSPFAYYGMTRSGVAALAMGMDNTNDFIWGTGPTRGNGATIDTVQMKLNSHTGDLTLFGKLAVPGIATLSNYYTTSSTPTIVVGADAGTGATVSITGTNQDGTITVNTGTGATNGVLCTVTLSGFAYPNMCTPTITHLTSQAITGDVTIDTPTNNSFGIYMNGGVTSSVTYKWTYHNGGY